MTHTVAPGGEARGPARIAVVGAGPAGLYAVTELVESGHPVKIDVFERLPSPFGLVRYGVAPDNQKIKSVARVLGAPFTAHSATVRFLGNVSVGRDISRHELRGFYDAVIYAFGAEDARVLDVPGSRLPGSFAAKEFVGWYSGHPDAADRNFPLHGRGVAVVGAGNVALDVARVLARSAEEIAATDVPDRVVTALGSSAITDIYLLCRRGPAQMKFTPVELRELGELSNADLIIDPTELALSESERAELLGRPQLERMALAHFGRVGLARGLARELRGAQPQRGLGERAAQVDDDVDHRGAHFRRGQAARGDPISMHCAAFGYMVSSHFNSIKSYFCHA